MSVRRLFLSRRALLNGVLRTFPRVEECTQNLISSERNEQNVTYDKRLYSINLATDGRIILFIVLFGKIITSYIHYPVRIKRLKK